MKIFQNPNQQNLNIAKNRKVGISNGFSQKYTFIPGELAPDVGVPRLFKSNKIVPRMKIILNDLLNARNPQVNLTYESSYIKGLAHGNLKIQDSWLVLTRSVKGNIYKIVINPKTWKEKRLFTKINKAVKSMCK